MGLAAGPIVLLAVMVILYVQSNYQQSFRAELQERGKAIGLILASRSRDLVLTNNLFALYTMAKETVAKNPDVPYVFIADPSGEILVHTFEGGFPEDLLRLGHVPVGMEYRTMILETEEGLIQHVAIPVLEGKLGVVHLGLSERRLFAVVGQGIWSIVSVAAVVLVIVWVWTLVAMIIGVRQALDFKNTWNAIWVCVVGLIMYWLVYIIFYFAYGLPKPAWS